MPTVTKYDFSGWATKRGVRCADGRRIHKGAFRDNDGKKVPLVYMHNHKDLDNVLGHCILEARDEGMYAYGFFNDTPKGRHAKETVQHGDLDSLSIWANDLTETESARGLKEVYHGDIKEVSLVLAGANRSAYIDNPVISHSDGSWEEDMTEAEIRFNIPFDSLSTIEHADNNDDPDDDDDDDDIPDKKETKKKTVGDVLDTLNEDQQLAVAYLLEEQAKKGAPKKEQSSEGKKEEESPAKEDVVKHSDDEGGMEMPTTHNIFEQDAAEKKENVLSHAEMMEIVNDAKENGTSLKKAFLAHGISNIDYLFPEAKLVRDQPDMISRPMEWVTLVWNGFHKSPFSRIKSQAADITGEDARARGYIKGDRKEEEVISLLRRETTPQTVYKLQKLDRDDIIDIVDLDVVAWIKAEMRTMLNEELSRAALIGDGRSATSREKIKEDNIRPIWTDDDLYTIKYTVKFNPETDDSTDIANTIIEGAIRARKDYRGSGSPTLFCSTDTLTTLLLSRDKIGRLLYKSESELASAMRVSRIVEVPVMESLTRTVTENGSTVVKHLLGIIVNLSDYTVGADKGGAVNMFDDFDINFNKYTYLIETRCSGCLTKPFSAIALEAEYTTGTDNPPIKINVDAKIPANTDLLGKVVGDLQANVNVTDGRVYGTLFHVTDYTGFSGDVAEQSGNYLALHITSDVPGATIQVNGTTLDEDGLHVTRITKPGAGKIVITASKTGYATVTKTLRLSTLDCELV